MYKDWQYFLNEARKIISAEGVRYKKETSGYNKGDYSARLDLKGVEWEKKTDYLVGKYGCNIATYGRISSTTKEQTLLYLTNDIARSLKECNRKTQNQYLSELWDYYVNKRWLTNESINQNYVSEIGERIVDYFKILDGTTNEQNWREQEYNSSTSIGNIVGYRELYFFIKKEAKDAYLNKRIQYFSHKNTYEPEYKRLVSQPNNYIWDEEKIPVIAEIEKQFIEVVPEPKKVVSVPAVNAESIVIDESKNTGFIKVGYRPEFLKTPILFGRERVLILANGEKHRSQYVIVEISEILSSHHEQFFTDTVGYPVNSRGENINDRNYSGDKNAQARVIAMAQNFEPETQVSTSASASGLPIISIDGVVVSGNNRTMSMKRMIDEYPENYTEYLKVLAREIETFGFDKTVGYNLLTIGSEFHDKFIDRRHRAETFRDNKYIDFKHPILLRIDYDFPAYNTGEMNKYNKDTKKTERPIDRAIKLSAILLDSEKCFKGITDLVSGYETLSELYANPNDIKLLRGMLSESDSSKGIGCNILTQQEMPGYFTDQNTLTANGKEFLTNLLAGMILDKRGLVSSEIEGVKRLKEKVVTALPVLITNAKLKKGSLKENINNAIILQQKLVSLKMKLADYVRTPAMFEGADEDKFTQKDYFLNYLLTEGKKYDFKKFFESYNNSAEQSEAGSMFGDTLTPDEIFDGLIKNVVEKEVYDVIKKFAGTDVTAIQETPAEASPVSDDKAKAKARAKAKIKIMQMRARQKTVRFGNGGNIAPNGKPSNLTAEQYLIVRSTKFRMWFGDWLNIGFGEKFLKSEIYKINTLRDKINYSSKIERNEKVRQLCAELLKKHEYFNINGLPIKATMSKFKKILRNFNDDVVYQSSFQLSEIIENCIFFDDEFNRNYENEKNVISFLTYFKLCEFNARIYVCRITVRREKCNEAECLFLHDLDLELIEKSTHLSTLPAQMSGGIKMNGRYKDNKIFLIFQTFPENISKVIDRQGEPLVVYHGTNQNFSIFRPSLDGGNWFTDNKDVAQDFAENTGAYNHKILKTFLCIRNPMNFDFHGEFLSDSKEMYDVVIAQNELHAKKHDGFILANVKDYVNKEIVSNVYNAFSSNQIKLADGSNTTFDGNNPDIRFDGGGAISIPSNLSDSQKRQIEAIQADYSIKMKEMNLRLKAAKQIRDKSLAKLQNRCGLFGDTAANPTAAQLFDTELECSPETYEKAQSPHVAKIRAIEAEIESLKRAVKHQVAQITAQTEMFISGGKIAARERARIKINYLLNARNQQVK